MSASDNERIAYLSGEPVESLTPQERAELDRMFGTEEVLRDREELAEQIRALGELHEMAAGYGHDISRPAATAPPSPAGNGTRPGAARRASSAACMSCA